MVLQHHLKSWFLQHNPLCGREAAGDILTCSLSCRDRVGTLVTWAQEVTLDHQDQR